MKTKMKMRQLVALPLALVVCSLSAGELMAQRGGMMRMLGGGNELASTLLVMSEVHDELKLTDGQKQEISEKAAEINDTFRSEVREILMGGGEMEEVRELMEELREEEQEIVGKLNEEQTRRFRQLQYQRMGHNIYRNKEVQKGIGVSDEQKQQIEDAFASMEEKLGEARQEAMEARDFQAMREAMESLNKELNASIDEILTEDQKSGVQEMQGKAFQFPQRRRPQRRRSDF